MTITWSSTTGSTGRVIVSYGLPPASITAPACAHRAVMLAEPDGSMRCHTCAVAEKVRARAELGLSWKPERPAPFVPSVDEFDLLPDL